ncbi:MAG: hypothetical protein CVV46_15400 [Spirochaetae bacterium HGW-Spirochaetae-2]|jgi:hypothetical protein|nr:MAG: hypothetical protein CVV46_15400 [Spirochaetae bacterium HGW-Spirochaetae-2]
MRVRPIGIVLFCLVFLVSCTTGRDVVQLEPIEPVAESPAVQEVATDTEEKADETLAITWDTTAEQWRGMYGHRQTVSLPPNGHAKPYYGYGSFDLDSSIGSAAVGLELLTYEKGGTVTIELREGPEYHKGGAVLDASEDTYEGWNTVFVFIDENGQEIAPEADSIIEIPDPDEPEVLPTQPAPTYFTVHNETGTTLTYLDIYTYDMMAVDELGYNLLPQGPLPPGDSAQILFSEHKDLEEAILYRYAQLLHVFAENEELETFYREWYPDFETLDLRISAEHLYLPESTTETAANTIRIENQTDYDIIELYILTPNMEVGLDFSKELLGGIDLYSGLFADIFIDQWPYLQEFLSNSDMSSLLIIAYDEDDYMLVKDWFPAYDSWTIRLTYDDYFDL